MSPRIRFDTPDGIATETRDEFHDERDGWVIGYDKGDSKPKNKLRVPVDRVVRIDG